MSNNNWFDMDGSTLFLTEFQTKRIPADQFGPDDIALLNSAFREVIVVDQTASGDWRLTPQGWCGYLSLPSGVQLAVSPKVPIENLFEMVVWAYGLPAWRRTPGQPEVSALNAVDALYQLLIQYFLELLKEQLALGLHREFVSVTELSQVVRGKIDTTWLATHPSEPVIKTDSNFHTADIIHNQILKAVLILLRHHPAVDGDRRKEIRGLLPRLRVEEIRLTDTHFEGLTYAPGMARYETMHRLCRFFFESTQPTHHAGSAKGFSFLINMAQLFERCVAAWLKAHLPAAWKLSIQRRKMLFATARRYIEADLVIYDEQQQAVWVLDTKYKAAPTIALEDLYQVTFYAREFQATHAGLIYPKPLAQPMTGTNLDVEYASFAFDLSESISVAGNRLVEGLVKQLSKE